MKKLLPLILFHFFLTSGYNALAQGSWQWAVTNLPYSGHVEAWPTATDVFGNVFVSGTFTTGTMVLGPDTLVNSGGVDPLIVKVDSSGNVQWCITGHGGQEVSNMTTDALGNLYVIGQYMGSSITLGTITLTSTVSIMNFMAKIAPGGTVLWMRNISGYNYRGGSAGRIALDAENNIFVSGTFTSSTTTIGTTVLINSTAAGDSADVFVAKYDSTGFPIWANSFGGNKDDDVRGMSVTPDGNVFLSGWYSSLTMIIGTDTLTDSIYYSRGTSFTGQYSYLARFDSSGHPVWAKNSPRHANVYSIKTDTHKNLYIGGTLDSSMVTADDTLIDPYGATPYVMKYDSSGSYIWGNAIYADRGGVGFSIDVDTCGNVWLSGNARGVMHIDGYFIDTPLLWADIMFLAAFDHCGRYIPGTGQELGSGGDDLMEIVLDKYGNLFLGGDYTGIPMVFGTDTLAPPGHDEWLLIAKYRIGLMPCDTIPCRLIPEHTPTIAKSPEIILSPNPATTECTVSSNSPFPTGAKAELYDITGRLIHTYTLTGNKTTITTSDLLPGLYTCRITTDAHNTIVKKLVIVR